VAFPKDRSSQDDISQVTVGLNENNRFGLQTSLVQKNTFLMIRLLWKEASADGLCQTDGQTRVTPTRVACG